MTVQAHTADRRLVVLAVLGVVLALTAAMWTLAGCAPKAEPSAPAAAEQKDGNGGSSAMDGQPVNWTKDSDCSMCHTVEAASATDASCPQASAHEAEGVTCVQCHTDEAALSTEHADVKFGDKAATKATVVTVDPETCISCHGTMEEMAAKTADSTALTDDKGTVDYEAMAAELLRVCYLRTESVHGDLDLSWREASRLVDDSDMQNLRNLIVGHHRLGARIPFDPRSSGQPETT